MIVALPIGQDTNLTGAVVVEVSTGGVRAAVARRIALLAGAWDRRARPRHRHRRAAARALGAATRRRAQRDGRSAHCRRPRRPRVRARRAAGAARTGRGVQPDGGEPRERARAPAGIRRRRVARAAQPTGDAAPADGRARRVARRRGEAPAGTGRGRERSPGPDDHAAARARPRGGDRGRARRRRPRRADGRPARGVVGIGWSSPGSRLRVDAHEPTRARASPDAVEYALDVLLDNACSYAPGAPLEIAVRTRVGRAEVRVRDYGDAVAAGEVARIGERFWRSSAHRRVAGTGLGVATARALLEASGASLILEPADPGLAATVSLPEAREAMADTSEPRPGCSATGYVASAARALSRSASACDSRSSAGRRSSRRVIRKAVSSSRSRRTTSRFGTLTVVTGRAQPVGAARHPRLGVHVAVGIAPPELQRPRRAAPAGGSTTRAAGR